MGVKEVTSTADCEFSWLSEFAPGFQMCGDKITVLTEPRNFYTTLMSLVQNSTFRIAIASLYIGTGNLEQQLVDTLGSALNKSENPLRVQILLDYTRGSRGVANSRSMLLPLLSRTFESGEAHDVHVAFYHTPDLRGLLKRFVPDRWNEIIGIAHMKIYVVDDVVIMSGANLSQDYFTNRQDRYVMLEDKQLASFFESLIQTVSTFSLQLQKDNSTKLHNDWAIHPYEGDYYLFKSEVKKKMESFIASWMLKNSSFAAVNIMNKDQQCLPTSNNERVLIDHNIKTCQAPNKVLPLTNSKLDTTVFPLVQLGPFGIKYDAMATECMFRRFPICSKVVLASGYFNLTSRYIDLILNASKAEYSILTASPKANGFFGGKGISGSIPKLYTYVTKLFFEKVLQTNQKSRFEIYEYERPNWTFHSKGLWCFLSNESAPVVTFIGSPNFGYRSVHRDLEAQVAIVTRNEQLKQHLFQEQQKLLSLSTLVTNHTFKHQERYVPIWVRLFTKAFKNFF